MYSDGTEVRVVTLVTLRKDGSEVHKGDTVTDFRGEDCTFERATRAGTLGRSGQVTVRERLGVRNDDVFGLRVIGLAECGCPVHLILDEGHQAGCSTETEQ